MSTQEAEPFADWTDELKAEFAANSGNGDIDSTAGKIESKGLMVVDAGRDLVLSNTALNQSNVQTASAIILDAGRHIHINKKAALTNSGSGAISAAAGGNITINDAKLGSSGQIYTAAKAALLSLTRTASADLGPVGVTVNMVSGGLLRTTDASAATPDAVFDLIAGMTPLRHVTTPEEFADAVLFFASPWSRAVTGQNLVVDGGLVRD